MNKKIVIGCVGVFLIGLVLIVGLVIGLRHRFPLFFTRKNAPSYLETPRIELGDDVLSKRVFVQDKNLRSIHALTYGEYDPAPGLELVIAGQTGALFVNEQGEVKSSCSYDGTEETFLGIKEKGSNLRFGAIKVMDVDGDGKCEFLFRDSLSKGELLDHQGSTIWQYGEGIRGKGMLKDFNAVISTADGTTKYAVIDSHGKGVCLLDSSLQELWCDQNAFANNIEFVELSSPENLGVLYDDYSRIVLRDIRGKVISKEETHHYIGGFSIVRWPAMKNKQFILHFSDNIIRLLDFNGKTEREFQAPLSKELLRAHGVFVKLKANKPEYFAAIAEYSVFERSVFYLYDPAGNLVYQEIIPESCGAITTLPLANLNAESIILGGNGVVWQYQSQK